MGLLGTIATVAGNLRQALPPMLPAELFVPLSPSVTPLPANATPADPPSVSLDPAPALALAPPPRPAPVLDGATRRQVGEMAARNGEAATRAAWLKRAAQAMMSDGEADGPPLDQRFATLVQSWQTLAGDPTDKALQQAVIAAGVVLAAGIRAASAGTEALAKDLSAATSDAVTETNRLLTQVHRANRGIIGLAARGESSDAMDEQREAALGPLVELTGTRIFPRQNRQMALYTPDGTALLEQRPLVLQVPGEAPQPGAVPADVIREGKLGALLRLTADGSATIPPTQPTRDGGSEVVRKLRSHLDAMTQVLTGRTRPGQPTSVADAYDMALADAKADGEKTLPYGFFKGDRLTLEVAAALTDGTAAIKPGATAPVIAALTARRTLVACGISLTTATPDALYTTITRLWQDGANASQKDSSVAGGALEAMEARSAAPPASLEDELRGLQTLDTARISAAQLSRGTRDLLATLRSLIPDTAPETQAAA